VQRDPSQEIALTDEHIDMLERSGAKFRAANPTNREKMVIEAANHVETTWGGSVEFNRAAVISVRDLSATLDYSHPSIAYSRTPIWQG
jgi:hypothetical protein